MSQGDGDRRNGPAGRTFNRRTLLKASAAAGATAAVGLRASPGFAEDAFPSKPITILVPWAPGGGTGQISEAVSKIATEAGYSKQRMVLDHKPGASGLVGTALVASRKGDAYMFMPAGGALLLQYVLGQTKINPTKDLTPLACSALDPAVVLVSKSSPYKSIVEVIDTIKKTPRSLMLAEVGAAGWDSVGTNMMTIAAGSEFNRIPFNSGGQVNAALIGGQVNLAVRQLSNAAELLKSGELRALAIFDTERNEILPDTPTMKEMGYGENLVSVLARAWFAPPGLKDNEIAWYGELFKKLSQDKNWQDYIQKTGSDNRYLGPAEWTAYIEKTMDNIRAVYKSLGLLKS
jgi:putative tricarboxylic transport membrane protein